METEIQRRRLMQLIAGAGTAITLTRPIEATNRDQEQQATIRTMPERNGPVRKSNFDVTIDEVEVQGWKTITLPTITGVAIESTSRNDSGGLVTPGEELVDLEMGRLVLPDDSFLFGWRGDVVQEMQETGEVVQSSKEVAITLQDTEGNPIAEGF